MLQINLSGKIAVVTGASGELGRVMVRTLASCGADVAIHYLRNQEKASELSFQESLILICGRYEGIDERIRLHFADEEISIGDYILTGGEIPAMVLVEAVSRLIPGILGDSESIVEESFSDGMLEYPQYTRPRDYKGFKVPDVLVSGDPKKIRAWQKTEALKKTESVRPDLFEKNKRSN